MSLSSDYYKKRKKQKEDEEKSIAVSDSLTKDYAEAIGEYASERSWVSESTRASVDEIAPVVTKNDEEDEEDKKDLFGFDFFQKGAFEDGYQFGDITKTILGTAGDAVAGIAKGVVSIGEGLGDLASYGVAGVAELAGNDDFAKAVRESAAENVTDEWFSGVDNYLDNFSVLGDTSDSIMQGVGQVGVMLATGGLGAAAGLGTVGTTALTSGVMFASSTGSGIGEAYQGGATDDEALKYGVFKGLVDAGTELLFGGLGKSVKALGVSKGISSLDDVFAKKLSSKISSHFWSNAAEYGVKASAEGVEEVLAGIGSAVGKKLTYLEDEELAKLIEDENLLEQFVVGAVTSGIAQGGDFVSSVKNGQDFITGLTENEQNVVDKEYENRLAEAEENGEKLDNKAKNKLYDSVLNDFEKGYISTDTIEEVLGGDTYKSYKDTIDSENALRDEYDTLKKEYDTLNEMKRGDMTGVQQDRQAELKAEMDELKAQIENKDAIAARDQLKAQLGDEVFSIAKDSRLVESYNEKARRGQAYEADLSKYDAKQQAVIQKAIDSGILNNTNRTHEFVDMVAKISADKGVLFDFADNAKLKESGFAINGAQVNGYVTKDGVTLNINSAKSLNSVVGHEITHILEGTELYTELQSVLFEYAKSKKDYQSRYDTLAALYKNVEGADIDAELTADLVGDYLFTDSDFISRLSVEHRNVFQKIYDEVKYLLKVATAGSAEARELEKVKRAFDKAYKESGKRTSDTKYSLSSMGTTFFGNENMSIEEFTAEDYKRTTGYQNYVNECLNNYKQSRGEMYDEAVARKEIEDGIDGIVRVAIAAKKAGYDIFDDGVKRSKTDSKNRLLFSSLEPNSDYFTSNDISTICDKRQNFADIYDDIVRAEEAKGVPQGKRFFDNIDNYFYLHGILASKGLTQPCRQCYVESMRKNLAPMASAFLRLVNETDANNTTNDQLYQQKGKNKGALKTNNAALRERVLEILTESEMSASDLTVEMLTTEDGLAQLKITAPLVYEAFNSFYGQSKPKMPKSATPFRFGELTALLTKDDGTINERLVKKINATGGFRLQSYSDFQIQNYTDVLQVIFEAGTLGLSGHAYTKVPAFLEATEGTNLKRNISIFMYKDGNEWKLDRNDSFPYTLEEIYDIVNADKSGNTGIIAVSQNEDMSAWIMANDNIAYGIPFHKSGLKMGTVRDTIVKDGDREIKGYSGTKDHTRQQTEVWAKTTADHKALTKVKDGINIYEFWDFDNKGNLPKNKLIEKNVKRYINECEKAGYLPKFREYVINNDKVLNSTLAYAKELGFVPQDATIEDISFKHKGYTIPYGYYKFLGDFGMFTPDGKASPHEALSLKEYDFDKAVKFFEDSETLRRNEILQQFANDGERQKYAESDLTAADLLELIKQKRVSVVDEVMSRYDAPTRNSLSAEGEAAPTYGNYNVRGKEIALETAQEIAPVQEDVAPVQDSVQDAVQVTTPKDEADELISAIMDEEFRLQGYDKNAEQDYAPTTAEEANAQAVKNLRTIKDADMPPEVEAPYQGEMPDTTAIDSKALKGIAQSLRDVLSLDKSEVKAIQDIVQKYSTTELPDKAGLANEIKEQYGERVWVEKNEELAEIKKFIKKDRISVSHTVKGDIPDYLQFMRSNFGKIRFSKEGIPVDTAYQELAEMYPAYFPADIVTESDQLLRIAEVANEEINTEHTYELTDDEILQAVDIITDEVSKYKEGQVQKTAEADQKAAFRAITDADAPMVDDVAPVAVNGKAALAEIANNGRRDNLKGAYTQDGKQYIADGSFIAEFNTVDNSLKAAKDFPAKKVLAELNEADARQTEGEYSIDSKAVAALNNGERNFIKVGNSLFDAKYVDTIISAIDNPVFTMSNVHGGDNALFVVGNNGRAVLMPVRAGDNVNVSYEAQPITDSMTVEDIMPIAENIAPVAEEYEAIKPKVQKEPRMVRADNAEQPRMVRADNKPNEKQRKWVGTSTESEAVNREILPDDLDQKAIHYQPIPNKVTLGKANAKLDGMGYDKAVNYFNSKLADKNTPSLEDIALGERLLQEAIKKGDTKTAGELIQDIAILGTELGQKVQALSIIKRLTPEGQLKMLQKVVERGKTKGDKAYEGVELTQDMIGKILKAYNKDGSFDQAKLNKAVEDVKQDIANKMKVTKLDKINAWRYLSMLGNPKTHIRNLVSNVAMRGTVAVKNVLARSIEGIAPIENRTKTWKRATDDVKAFAAKTTAEMQDILRDGGKYSEDASIKEKRKIFKSKILNGVYEFNSNMLSKEDWWFSKPAFTNAFAECLTANGIRTEEDILLNPEIVEKARKYATEQSQIATFRQYSWLSNKINEIERKNAATSIAVGAILPFKKTPINIAKTGLNYSPLGFAKTLTYDIAQVKNGKMEASELVDHLAQNITGTGLALVGFMLAQSGLLSGGGEDDKEGEYDYQLGEQAYAVNIGGKSYSLSWLSPVAMPLFVGANAYEQLVEGKEWNGDVVVETLAQTLDPLSEMSFISGLDSVLSSYDSGIEKFAGIGQSMAQNYITQFVPTLSSQVATVMDDTKRSTKVSGDSGFKFFDETINKLKLKIPVIRQTLEPSTDIWGNEVKQTEDVITRAVETFIAPYSKREDITTEIDDEIKSLYSATGDDGLIPSIPYNYVNYKDEKYNMSAEEHTAYKKTYGQTAFDMLGELYDTSTYQSATDEEKADMVNRVYDYARDAAKREYLAKEGVTYTNATEDNVDVFKENPIKGAIENDMSVDEYVFYSKYPEKHAVAKAVGGYDAYKGYSSELYDIKADKDEDGKSISGSRKEKVIEYINNLDADYGERIILFKSEYNADDTYNYDIIEYLNSRDDISYAEMETILKELGFTVTADGSIYW